MKLTVLLLVCGLLAINAANINLDTYPFEKEIAMVNSLPDATWTAGRQERFKGMTEEDVAVLCGVINGTYNPLPIMSIPVLKDIPAEFDARTKWARCPSIGTIQDQSNCGSCWAFGAAEAMSDRYCIHLNMSLNISAADLMECCESCGNGCEGGFPEAAWNYWTRSGICTGGLYEKSEDKSSTCKPYPLPSCEHHIVGKEPPCSKKIAKTPECTQTCHKGYTTPYKQDLHYGSVSYSLDVSVNGVQSIQTEIMTNGPVEAAFTVYSDFPTYKSGVYKRHSLDPLGGHAVKILGWGVLNGEPYWLVANSWNPDWGNKGFFLILRGHNECGIEEQITAGMPKN
ncbi:Cathepsin B [Oopsacas minuta]|uniref:Cathepsin B n=1 Tax=Oopsacas minuta TaxID=111878 RepID=A0AAV7K0X4_9METZ|nr:Cathepsin B [Oopsacas minuta]